MTLACCVTRRIPPPPGRLVPLSCRVSCFCENRESELLRKMHHFFVCRLIAGEFCFPNKLGRQFPVKIIYQTSTSVGKIHFKTSSVAFFLATCVIVGTLNTQGETDNAFFIQAEQRYICRFRPFQLGVKRRLALRLHWSNPFHTN